MFDVSALESVDVHKGSIQFGLQHGTPVGYPPERLPVVAEVLRIWT